MEPLVGILLFAAVIFGISVAVSGLSLGFKDAERHIHTLVSVGTGIMLGVLFLMILPEAIEEGEEAGFDAVSIMGFALAGFVLVFIINFLCNREGYGEHSHEFTSMAAFGGLVIHAAFDGVSLAAGFVAGEEVGMLILAAICLHKCAEVFSLSSTMALALGRRKSLPYMVGFSAVTPIAALVSYFVISGEVGIVGPAMAFSGGILLLVITHDMLPEIFHNLNGKSGIGRMAWFMLGLVIAAGVWFGMNALTGGAGI